MAYIGNLLYVLLTISRGFFIFLFGIIFVLTFITAVLFFAVPFKSNEDYFTKSPRLFFLILLGISLVL